MKFFLFLQVDYIDIVAENDKGVAMVPVDIWNWYHGWPTHSTWENRMAVMGEGDVLAWDVKNACPKVHFQEYILVGVIVEWSKAHVCVRTATAGYWGLIPGSWSD